MQRREFIAGLGAAAWPSVASAQQRSKIATIGVFFGTGVDESLLTAFTRRLRQLGWEENRNVAFEIRKWDGTLERSAEIAGIRSPQSGRHPHNGDTHGIGG